MEGPRLCWYITDSTSAIKGTGVPVASIKEDGYDSELLQGWYVTDDGRPGYAACMSQGKEKQCNGHLMIRGGHSMRVKEPKQ